MGAKARHGFQGVRSAADDVFPKRREVLEMAPPSTRLHEEGGGRKGE
jgi:hypothetical protein